VSIDLDVVDGLSKRDGLLNLTDSGTDLSDTRVDGEVTVVVDVGTELSGGREGGEFDGGRDSTKFGEFEAEVEVGVSDAFNEVGGAVVVVLVTFVTHLGVDGADVGLNGTILVTKVWEVLAGHVEIELTKILDSGVLEERLGEDPVVIAKSGNVELVVDADIGGHCADSLNTEVEINFLDLEVVEEVCDIIVSQILLVQGVTENVQSALLESGKVDFLDETVSCGDHDRVVGLEFNHLAVRSEDLGTSV